MKTTKKIHTYLDNEYIGTTNVSKHFDLPPPQEEIDAFREVIQMAQKTKLPMIKIWKAMNPEMVSNIMAHQIALFVSHQHILENDDEWLNANELNISWNVHPTNESEMITSYSIPA